MFSIRMRFPLPHGTQSMPTTTGPCTRLNFTKHATAFVGFGPKSYKCVYVLFVESPLSKSFLKGMRRGHGSPPSQIRPGPVSSLNVRLFIVLRQPASPTFTFAATPSSAMRTKPSSMSIAPKRALAAHTSMPLPRTAVCGAASTNAIVLEVPPSAISTGISASPSRRTPFARNRTLAAFTPFAARTRHPEPANTASAPFLQAHVRPASSIQLCAVPSHAPPSVPFQVNVSPPAPAAHAHRHTQKTFLNISTHL